MFMTYKQEKNLLIVQKKDQLVCIDIGEDFVQTLGFKQRVKKYIVWQRESSRYQKCINAVLEECLGNKLSRMD